MAVRWPDRRAVPLALAGVAPVMKDLPPVDVFDFREPLVIAGIHYGWAVDWVGYHAACDARDAYNEQLKAAKRQDQLR